MKNGKWHLPRISAAEVTVSYVDPDTASAMNQNESHIHDTCEIYLNLSGDVAFEVENRLYPICRGSAIITRPYEYHHCIYLSDKRHAHFWITFSGEESDELLKMFFCRKKGTDNLILLSDRQLEELCDVLLDLLENTQDPLKQRIGFLRVIHILQSGKIEEHTGGTAQLPPDVAFALEYMDAHLTEELDVQTLAAAGNVSVTTLERHFKEAFHATPLRSCAKSGCTPPWNPCETAFRWRRRHPKAVFRTIPTTSNIFASNSASRHCNIKRNMI